MSIDNTLKAMGTETKGRFESIRNQLYNPNIKGRFSFYEWCSLLDTPLRISEVFSDAENE